MEKQHVLPKATLAVVGGLLRPAADPSILWGAQKKRVLEMLKNKGVPTAQKFGKRVPKVAELQQKILLYIPVGGALALKYNHPSISRREDHSLSSSRILSSIYPILIESVTCESLVKISNISWLVKMEDFAKQACYFFLPSNVPWSKVGILGMVIPPLYNRNSFNGYINPYCWVEQLKPRG